MHHRSRCCHPHRPANTGRGEASPNGWSRGWQRTADAGRNRPRLLVSAALFRGASPQARLADVPRDFQQHWPTDEDHIYVDFVREGAFGNGAARMGNTRWRRLTEERAGGAKSVFHFDVQGSVAKSTHAGIPWLRFIRQRLGERVHFWPFDGWEIPAGRSAVAEVYPRYGAAASPARAARAISTMPTASRAGSPAPIRTVASPRSSSPS